jgi:hypothetical protein
LLPPDVFSEGSHEEIFDDKQLLRAQIAFVAQGESAYRSAEILHMEDSNDEETSMVKAAIVCDLGANILLQSQILAVLHGEGEGIGSNPSLSDILTHAPEVKASFVRAADTFRRAIDLHPVFAPPWCGLGSAVCGIDPVLAQHALVRSLQLDKMLPDAWSNLGFLYASHGLPNASVNMMDSLTQVADTPLMWICRAALLEREAFGSLAAERGTATSSLQSQLLRISDAYRAALQVMKHPSALLGLSLSCRMVPAVAGGLNLYSDLSEESSRKQSHGYMKEYIGMVGESNRGTSLLYHVSSVEDTLRKQINADSTFGQDSVDCSLLRIDAICNSVRSDGNKKNTSAAWEESKRGTINMKTILDVSTSRNETAQADVAGDNSLCFDHPLGCARQVLHDPQDGSLWLEMAKRLAQELPLVKGIKKRKLVRQTVEAAVLAANRAAFILSSQVTEPRAVYPSSITPDTEISGRLTTHGPVRCVSHASEVSEALALSYWVGRAGRDILDEKDTAVVAKSCTAFDLQKALFMCPNNVLAREAINSINAPK